MAIIKAPFNVISEPLRVLSLGDSSVANGSYTANAFGSDWTNAVGTRSGNTFTSTDPYSWAAKSVYNSRDAKIEGWWERGVIYARIANGKAIYFYHEANNQRFEVGVTYASDTSSPYLNQVEDVTDKGRYDAKDMSTVSGYSSTYNGTLFTIIIEGVDITVKYGNIEIMRLKDGYVQGDSGGIGVKTLGPLYDFKVTHLPRKTIYSNLAQGFVDVQDFEANTFHTTGSMSGYALVLGNATGLKPGMMLHTDLTGLPATNGRTPGKRGTRGMKTWPSLEYADATAMNADTTKPDGIYCWIVSTGKTYETTGGTWAIKENIITTGPDTVDNNYYLSKAIPINYRGKILSIIGNVCTMDTTTDVSFSGTNVYFDNSYCFSRITAAPFSNPHTTPSELFNGGRGDLRTFLGNKQLTINIPEGDFTFSEGWWVSDHPNIKLQGAGGRNGKTRLRALEGGNCYQMAITRCPNAIVQGLHFESNGRGDGYGLWWRDKDPNNAAFVMSASSYPYFRKEHYGSGPYFIQSPDSFVTDCKFTDFLQCACTFGSSDNSVADGFDVIHTTGHFKYMQWQINSDICNNTTFRNFTATFATIIGTGELFNGDGALYENGVITNGRCSSNSAANVNFKNLHFIYTANSRAPWLSPSDPCVNFNSNAYGYSRPGGSVEDCTFTFQDYTDTFHNLKTAIVVNAMANQDTFPDDYIGVSVKRCTLTGPNYASPATQMGPQLVTSTRKNTTVEDCVCTGTTGVNSDLYNASIGLNGPGGYLKRNTAYKMTVGSTVTVGTGADANTGTIVTI